jgi:hypothetical protein
LWTRCWVGVVDRISRRWANVAAGLAVQVFATAVLTRDELLDAWDARR